MKYSSALCLQSVESFKGSSWKRRHVQQKTSTVAVTFKGLALPQIQHIKTIVSPDPHETKAKRLKEMTATVITRNTEPTPPPHHPSQPTHPPASYKMQIKTFDNVRHPSLAFEFFISCCEVWLELRYLSVEDGTATVAPTQTLKQIKWCLAAWVGGTWVCREKQEQGTDVF